MRGVLRRVVCLSLTSVVVAASVSWVAGQQAGPEDEPAIQALGRTVSETGDLWLNAAGEAPNTTDLNAFAAMLRNRPDIAQANVTAESVIATTTDGIVMRFGDLEPGILGSGLPHRGVGQLPLGVVRHASLPPGLVGPGLPREPRCIGDMVPKEKALLIHVLPGWFDPRVELTMMLEYAGFEVTNRSGKVRDFLNMQESGVTVLTAHGGFDTIKSRKYYFVCAQYISSNDVTGFRECYDWLKEGQLITCCVIQRDQDTKKPVGAAWWISILDSWFEKNLRSLPRNAAAIFVCCNSATTDILWNIFRSKGASAYFGFSGKANYPWGAHWAMRLVDRVTGANFYEPWDTSPFRRPQSFEGAYKYILTKPDYQTCSAGGKPDLSVCWPNDNFSAYPHIDCAQIGTFNEETTDYKLDLYGAFAQESECEVVCDIDFLKFRSIAGGQGAPLEVRLPKGAKGDLFVLDQHNRKSNPITISRFKSTVKFEFNDMTAAGTIELRYDCPAIGSRLYRDLDSDLRYAGWPEEMEQFGVGHMPYLLVLDEADWELEWHFDSVKTVGGVVIRAKGEGSEKGRGSGDDPEDEKPDGALSVLLSPSFGDKTERTCKAQVQPHVTVGPITETWQTPVGPQSRERMVRAVGLAGVVDYDQISGVLPAVSAGGLLCRWEMEEVKLDPPPCDFEKQASVPSWLMPASPWPAFSVRRQTHAPVRVQAPAVSSG